MYYTKITENNGFEDYNRKLKGLLDQRSDLLVDYYLATIHRPENTDNEISFFEILKALNQLEYPVILSTHPRIKDKVLAFGRGYQNIYFVEPLSYIDSIFFSKHAIMVITDSGGCIRKHTAGDSVCNSS